MIKIYRELSDETTLKKLHVDKLGPIIESRIKLAQQLVSAAGTKSIENLRANIDASIKTKFITTALNQIIGKDTKYTKQSEWENFKDKKNIRTEIISGKTKIKNYLSKLTSQLIEEILLVHPESQKKLVNKVSKIIDLDEVVYINKLIFDYTILTDGSVLDYSASDFIIHANIHSCPYCNAAPIEANKIVNSSTGQVIDGARADLDHFEAKAQTEIFALSFFNLIPSCLSCNMRLKSTNEFRLETHLHPYLQGFEREDHEGVQEQVFFAYEFINTGASGKNLIDLDDFTVHIKIDKNISRSKHRRLYGNNQGASKKEGNVVVFELEQKYQHRAAKQEVLRMINLFDKNSPAYIDSLKWFPALEKNTKGAYEGAIQTSYSKELFALDNYSKLKRDIFLQLIAKNGIKINH